MHIRPRTRTHTRRTGTVAIAALAIIGLTSKEIAQRDWVRERINDWRKEKEREQEAPEPEGVEPLGQMIMA